MILKNLWSDKRRQNTVKRGVLVDGENKGVGKFEVAENKKRQLGSWRYEIGGKLLPATYCITMPFFVKQNLSRTKRRGNRKKGKSAVGPALER